MTEQLVSEELAQQYETAENDIVRLVNENNASTAIIQDLQSNLMDMTREKEEQATAIQDAMQSVKTATDEKDVIQCQLSDLQVKYESIQSTSSKEGEELRANISDWVL
jgi:chromosome segregation ATPase